jgi:sensor histidine kinase YesM/ligand-binding sensor domain-containing protein
VRYYFFIILTIIFFNESFGQNFPRLNFRHLSETDGLSNNMVYAITQDKRGIMWIATKNGLNRYDGTRIKKIFAHPKDTNALQSNFLPFIKTDFDGNIFLNYNSGFHILNPITNSYINNEIVANCHLRYQGKDYVFSESGIYKLINGKAQLDTLWNVLEKTRKQQNNAQYNNVVSDKKGNLWACTSKKIYKIDFKSKKVVETYPVPYGGFFRNLFFDSNDDCWITTWGLGIVKLDKKSKALKIIGKDDKNAVTFSINEWIFNGKRYIVCGANVGLILLDPDTYETKLYQNLTNQAKVIGECLHLFIDRDNNIWISSTNGVHIVTSFSFAFDVIPITSGKKNSISGVYQCRDLPSGYWISKRYFGGIFQYDKNWNLIQHWKEVIPPKRTKFPTSRTDEGYDFIQKDNYVYITIESGLVKLNLNNKKTEVLQPNSDVPPRLRNILELNDTTWVIRSYSNGIYFFNPKRDTFYKWYKILEKNSTRILELQHITKNDENELFVSSRQGLFKFNRSKDSFEPLEITNETTQSYGRMAFDQNGLLWIGSINGLLAIDINRKEVVKDFDNFEEMGEVDYLAIDKDDKVWFHCGMGYWCYNQQSNQMLQFSYGSGLPKQDDESNFFTLSDDNAYGGSVNSIVKFKNDFLKKYQINSKIVLSEILVNGKTHNSLEYLNDSISLLSLKNEEKNLDIYFSITDYAQQGCYTYYYKLNPGIENWTKVENGFIGLNNMSHGKHGLELKAQNSFTGKFTPIYQLKFSIAPKWYQTLSFRILAFFSIGFFLFHLLQYRANQIRKNENLRKDYENKMLNLEMQNLRSQMNPHFIFNSLNSINRFIIENKTNFASDYLTKFARLIRLILDNSKNEIISLEKEIEALKLYLLMESIRFENKFDYEVIVSETIDLQMIKIPPMIIQPYVENAIWHGLLHKEEKGKVVVFIDIEDNELHISIEDNGIGRGKAAKLKSKNSNTNKSYGLQITEQRIKQLNSINHIEISDLTDEQKKPSGTKVKVTIKL